MRHSRHARQPLQRSHASERSDLVSWRPSKSDQTAPQPDRGLCGADGLLLTPFCDFAVSCRSCGYRRVNLKHGVRHTEPNTGEGGPGRHGELCASASAGPRGTEKPLLPDQCRWRHGTKTLGEGRQQISPRPPSLVLCRPGVVIQWQRDGGRGPTGRGAPPGACTAPV